MKTKFQIIKMWKISKKKKKFTMHTNVWKVFHYNISLKVPHAHNFGAYMTFHIWKCFFKEMIMSTCNMKTYHNVIQRISRIRSSWQLYDNTTIHACWFIWTLISMAKARNLILFSILVMIEIEDGNLSRKSTHVIM